MNRAPSPRLGFLFTFAFQDLFDRRSLGATLVIALTVALVTGLTVLSFGLPQAAEQVRLSQLKRQPLALCLWAWDPDRLTPHPITSTRVDELNSRLTIRLQDAVTHAACFPFHETRFAWQRYGTAERPEFIPDVRGRTLPTGDPLLNNFPLTSGEPFHDDQPGVIVTPAFLERLGYPSDTKPGTELHISSLGSGRPVSVPLVGVLGEPLPLNYSFILTERYESELLTTDPDLPAQSIWTGPIHPDWPHPIDLPPIIRADLRDLQLSRPVLTERTGQPPVWELTSNRIPPPRVSLWREYIVQIHKRMQESPGGLPRAPRFEDFEPHLEHPEMPARAGHDLVGVYVRDLSDLAGATQAIRDVGLETDDGIRLQINAYAEAADAAQRILVAIVLVVGIVAVVNLIALQTLRVQKKIAEIGMLRAVGMSGPVLWLVYSLEAGILWILGTTGGLALAIGIGMILHGAYASEEQNTYLTVEWGQQVVQFMAASALACWVSALVATWRAGRAAPAEALSRQ